MMDSTITDKRAAIDNAILGKESLDMRYLRIDMAIEANDLTTAQSLLDDIPADFELRGLKNPESAIFLFVTKS